LTQLSPPHDRDHAILIVVVDGMFVDHVVASDAEVNRQRSSLKDAVAVGRPTAVRRNDLCCFVLS